MKLMVVVILGIFGLIFGSFVSATVWRIYEQSRVSGKNTSANQKLSISKGRSMCAHCKHELAPKDLVPLFSWLWLKGKCRYCHLPIDDSPYTELATACLFMASYAFWPESIRGPEVAVFIAWLAVVVVGVMLAVYDLRWYLLPNRLVAPFIGLSAVFAVLQSYTARSLSELVGAVIGGLLLSGIFFALFQISNGEWIGGGDVKLALGLGLAAGSPLGAALVLFAASTIGTLFSLPTLLSKRRDMKAKIPFGPFLLTGMAVVVLFGDFATKYLLNQ